MVLRRGVDAAMMSSLNKPFHPILFIHLAWPVVPVYAHTGVGIITWGGNDWTGVGPVASIDVPAEALGGVVATEAVISLAGVPADLDGYADDQIRGRAVDVYFGVLAGRPGGHDGRRATGPGNTLIGTPVRMFSGTMDGLGIDASETEEGVEHTASVRVSTGPGARSLATITHSDEDQRRKFPTDTAGRLVIMSFANMQKLTWPEN